MIKKVMTYLSLIIALGAVTGLAYKTDQRYAKQYYVSDIEQRMEAKFRADRIKAIQEEMWRMEDRWYKKFIQDKQREPEKLQEVIDYMNIKSEDAKKRYKDLNDELKELQDHEQ